MITVNELRDGLRATVSLTELVHLLGLSKSTIYRRLWQGNWLPFYRDSHSRRIFFSADKVLAYLNGLQEHACTTNYHHDGIDKMARARAAKGLSKKPNKRLKSA